MSGIVQVKISGRLGNQLFQYAAARAYAEHIHARFECGEWIGPRLFEGMHDAPLSCELPNIGADGDDFEWGRTDIVLGGYHQTQRWADLLSRHVLRRWFTFKREWLDLAGPKPHPWYTACHVRRGDYVGHQLYCTVSKASYTRAMMRFGIPGPVVWISDEDPGKASAGPQDLDRSIPDFITLMRADVLFRANSSYSLWAGLLSQGKVFSPIVEARTGEYDVDFSAGNHNRCADPASVGVPITDFYVKD